MAVTSFLVTNILEPLRAILEDTKPAIVLAMHEKDMAGAEYLAVGEEITDDLLELHGDSEVREYRIPLRLCMRLPGAWSVGGPLSLMASRADQLKTLVDANRNNSTASLASWHNAQLTEIVYNAEKNEREEEQESLRVVAMTLILQTNERQN